MLYTIICRDKPGQQELRQATREDHLAYIESAAKRLKFAGPILADDDSAAPTGSLIILEAASREAVELFVMNDPYCRAGLFQSTEILLCRQVLGSSVDSGDSA